MRRSTLILLSFAVLAISIFAVDKWHNQEFEVSLVNARGREVGTVKLRPVQNHGTLVIVVVTNLAPGFHGFHIHEHGRCEVTNEGVFITAGGHFDTTGQHHGHHTGDMPSLVADENGNATLVFHTSNFTLRELLADNGTAFIIHAGADNFANIPQRYGGADDTTLANGDAGARVACSVISRR